MQAETAFLPGDGAHEEQDIALARRLSNRLLRFVVFEGPAAWRGLLTSKRQCAGIVTIAAWGTTPVSASEENILRNMNTRLEFRSRSSTQNQDLP